MVPAFYLKYAVLTFKMSSWVKTDPPISTGSRKHGWSQNLMSLTQKTKIWHNNVISRIFEKYSFCQGCSCQKTLLDPSNYAKKYPTYYCGLFCGRTLSATLLVALGCLFLLWVSRFTHPLTQPLW